MSATATTAIYVALFALFAFVRPWTPTVAVDALLLAAFLALCRRHGLDALRGTQLHRPLAGSLLLVLPLAFVLGSYSISGPWAPGILFLLAWVPLHLGWSFFRRRRRGGRARAVEGVAILAAPVVLFAMLGGLSAGFAGGVMMLLMAWLDFSFGYAGSGVSGLVPAAAAAAVVAFLLLRFAAGRDVVTSAFASLLLVYAVGAYLLFVVYYDLPIEHTIEDVAAQPHTRMLTRAEGRGAGRTLYVDEAEETLYLTVKSTQMTAAESESGLLSYDIASGRETAFVPLAAPCITMVVDEAARILYSCQFFTHRLLLFDLDGLAPTGVEVQLDESMRPEGLVRLDEGDMLVRFEIPGEAPDLLRFDSRALETTPIRLPERPLIVGCYALTLDRGRREIWVPQLGNNTIVLNRLDWEGRHQASVDLRGLSYEAVYSPFHDAVFVATLNRHVLYRVHPETLEVTETRVPNGIRAVRATPDGLLVLGDYIRGRVHLYDPDADEIVRTLLVGGKPQAIGLGPVSGSLYVYSDFGITVFDVPRIVADAGWAPRGGSSGELRGAGRRADDTP